jgi:predicted transcriptional regulator
MIGSIYDFFTLSRQVQEANMRKAFNQVQETNIRTGLYGQHGGRAEAGSYRTARDVPFSATREKESPERTILRLAKQNAGVLSVSELALESNISIDNAKKELDALVSKGIMELRVRKTGTLVYTLPEFMDANAPLEYL